MCKFIEVQHIGDFDVLQTTCIMFKSDNKKSAKELRDEFCKMERIEDPVLINDRMLHEVTDDFIAYLELMDFKRVNTDSIYFCN